MSNARFYPENRNPEFFPADIFTSPALSPSKGMTARKNVKRTIVTRAQEGDAGAVAALLKDLAPRLHRFAMRLTGDGNMTESVVEETFYRGVLKLKKLRRPDRVYAWFRRILLNVWRDELRSRKHRSLSLDAIHEPQAPLAADPVTRLHGKELKKRVAEAMAVDILLFKVPRNMSRSLLGKPRRIWSCFRIGTRCLRGFKA